MADVPLPGFPNSLYSTATATLDSLYTHWNSLLKLCPITTSITTATTTTTATNFWSSVLTPN
jgi:hypothetical protein